MSDSNKDNWLSNYYNRIQGECDTSFERRDRITNWAYVILATAIATYAGFFADGNFVIPLGRFSLVAGVLFVLIRFFFQSMIAYGFYLKWRHLRTIIEQHWANNDPFLDKIIEDIEKYDHGKSMPPVERNRLVGQIRSGFVLILIIPTIPLAIELYRVQDNIYFLIIGALIAYVLLEWYNFKTYDQIQPPKKPSN